MYDLPFNQLQNEGPFLVLNHRSASLPSNFLHVFLHKSLIYFVFVFVFHRCPIMARCFVLAFANLLREVLIFLVIQKIKHI